MKKLISVILISIFPIYALHSQEWLTSMEVAKKLALMQDKMIFAVWEDAMFRSRTPIIINNNMYPISDLAAKESHSRLIWKYFVPLVIPEYTYRDLLGEIDGKRSLDYMYKFNDNHVKIMDPNGNILNSSFNENEFEDMNFASILEKYALNTSFLKNELKNYSVDNSFNSSFRLALRYLDYAIFANKSIKKELTDLSDIYMKEANEKLQNETPEKQFLVKEKIKLLKIKKTIILNNPNKALRKLKRFDPAKVEDSNLSLLAFLHFASNRLLNDIDSAMIWQNEVSLADLKKVKYLINNN